MRHFIVLAAMAAALAGIPRSFGQSIVYVRAGAPGGGNGANWGQAFADLETALALARSGPTVVGEIWVAAGVYFPSRLLAPPDPRSATYDLVDGVAVYGGFAGGEASLTQRDPVANPTILDGALPSGNAYHVVHAQGLGSAALLDGFVVRNGRALGLAAPFDAVGGGILVRAGTLAIGNCVVRNNDAYAAGGLFSYFGHVRVRDSVFEDNTAVLQAAGVGVQSDDGISSNVTTSSLFERVAFRRNLAGRRGGLRCRFTGNTAAVDGGGLVFSESVGSVTGCLFSGNTAVGNGGGVGIDSSSSVTLAFSTFSANTAGVAGGGLRADSGSSGAASSLAFWGNQDASGSTSGAQLSAPASSVSLVYSLIQGGYSGPGGIGIVAANPLLSNPLGVDLVLGTPDDDPSPGAGSPLIDAAQNAAIPGGYENDLKRAPRRCDDAATPDTGAGAPPLADIGAFEFVSPVVGAQTVRLGSPPNPLALPPPSGGPPMIGRWWSPSIDHASFVPGAVLDFLGVGLASLNSPTPFGTLLGDATLILVGAVPGAPVPIPVPNVCELLGLPVTIQGASLDGQGVLFLTNALDVTIGGP